MNPREEILEWMQKGCDINTGVTLYSRYGDNYRFKVILYINPLHCKERLRLLLTKIAGVKSTDYSTVVRDQQRDSFREEYPFLAEPNCPMELKALAADKITAYWKCVDLHAHLFDCHKNEACRDTASALVHTFIEDQLIKRELDYYKNHKGILGEHPIFAEQRKISAIRHLSVRELIKKEQQLRDNIWRIKDELSKPDKPHLTHKRQQRLAKKQQELELVMSLQKD